MLLNPGLTVRTLHGRFVSSGRATSDTHTGSMVKLVASARETAQLGFPGASSTLFDIQVWPLTGSNDFGPTKPNKD